jgi:hypothetical protein
MLRKRLFLLSLLALLIPHFISGGQQLPVPSTRAEGVGTIQGSIVRVGTAAPIPEVNFLLTALRRRARGLPAVPRRF